MSNDKNDQVLQLAKLNKESSAIGALTAAIISVKPQYQKAVQYSRKSVRLNKLLETPLTLEHPTLILSGKRNILFSENLPSKNYEIDSLFIPRVASPTGALITQELDSKGMSTLGIPRLIGARSEIQVMAPPLPVKEIVIIAEGDYLDRVVEVIKELMADPDSPSKNLLGGRGIASFPNRVADFNKWKALWTTIAN
jgi:hypothetical protein